MFKERSDAGKILAKRLQRYANRNDLLILALPRGGVPVAYEVARSLNAPLDVFVVRKLGAPNHEELAIGAIASGGIRVLNRSLIKELSISENILSEIEHRELRELTRREKLYRRDHSPIDLTGKTVIIVDDGLATGATMKCAIQGVCHYQSISIVVATPVASEQVCKELESVHPHTICICALTPRNFYGVGKWYQDFSQISDEEVCSLLMKRYNELERH